MFWGFFENKMKEKERSREGEAFCKQPCYFNLSVDAVWCPMVKLHVLSQTRWHKDSDKVWQGARHKELCWPGSSNKLMDFLSGSDSYPTPKNKLCWHDTYFLPKPWLYFCFTQYDLLPSPLTIFLEIKPHPLRNAMYHLKFLEECQDRNTIKKQTNQSYWEYSKFNSNKLQRYGPTEQKWSPVCILKTGK